MGVETDWIADLRLAWFGALRRMAEKANAQIDLDLMQSVYAKIQLRVQQGDAPRIELIRAEADLLNVQKAAQAAALREDQARLQLRALVGPDLPEDFTLTGQLEAPLPLPALGVLQDQALAANPRWPAPAPRWSRPATGWIMRNRGVCPSSAARHARGGSRNAPDPRGCHRLDPAVGPQAGPGARGGGQTHPIGPATERAHLCHQAATGHRLAPV
jgi:cobalt-zinc-cadmium efflux system outer membrane protein